MNNCARIHVVNPDVAVAVHVPAVVIVDRIKNEPLAIVACSTHLCADDIGRHGQKCDGNFVGSGRLLCGGLRHCELIEGGNNSKEGKNR